MLVDLRDCKSHVGKKIIHCTHPQLLKDFAKRLQEIEPSLKIDDTDFLVKEGSLTVSSLFIKQLHNTQLIKTLPDTLELTEDSLEKHLDALRVTQKHTLSIESKEPLKDKVLSKCMMSNTMKAQNIKIKLKCAENIAQAIAKKRNQLIQEIGLSQATYLVTQKDMELSDAASIPSGHLLISFANKDEADSFAKRGLEKPFDVIVIQSVYGQNGEQTKECYGIQLPYAALAALLNPETTSLKSLNRLLTQYLKLNIPCGFHEAIETWMFNNSALDSKPVSRLIAHYFKKPEEMLLDVKDWTACLSLCQVAKVPAMEVLTPLMDKAPTSFDPEQASLYLTNLFWVLDYLPNPTDILKQIATQKTMLEKISMNDVDLSLIPVKHRLSFIKTFQGHYAFNKEKVLQLTDSYFTQPESLRDFFSFLGTFLKSDELDSIIKEGLPSNELLLEFGSDALKKNAEYLLGLVRENIKTLQFADDTLKNNLDFMSKAVGINAFSLKYGSKEIQNNKEVVLKAIKQDHYALQYAGEQLKNDVDFMLEMVSRDGDLLQYGSEEIRRDEAVVRKAIKEDPYAIRYADKYFQNDVATMSEVVSRDGSCLLFGSAEIRRNEAVVRKAIKKCPDVIAYADNYFQNDVATMSEVVSRDGSCLLFGSAEIRRNEAVVRKAIKKDPHAIIYADKYFQNDVATMSEVVSGQGVCLVYGSETIKNNKKIVALALTHSHCADWRYIRECADKSLQDDDYLKWLVNILNSEEYRNLEQSLGKLNSKYGYYEDDFLSCCRRSLAELMEQKIKTFLSRGAIPSRSDCEAFKNEFNQLPFQIFESGKSYNEELSQHYAFYKVILANIAIALIPFIGIMAIGAKVMHSLYTENRVSFFFDKPYKERMLLESIECFDRFAKLQPKPGG